MCCLEITKLYIIGTHTGTTLRRYNSGHAYVMLNNVSGVRGLVEDVVVEAAPSLISL